MTLLQARVILLLAWLLDDRRAHLQEPILCEFQGLPWDPWSEVGGEPYQGRGVLADLPDVESTAWIREALAIHESVNAPGVGESSASPRYSNENQAVLLLLKSPEITDAEIARELGLHRSTVSRWGRLREARKAAFNPGRIVRGVKNSGDVEAWIEDEESGPVG